MNIHSYQLVSCEEKGYKVTWPIPNWWLSWPPKKVLSTGPFANGLAGSMRVPSPGFGRGNPYEFWRKIGFRHQEWLKMLVSTSRCWEKKVISAYPEVIQGTINRRKFRSQTSDNMDRWKAEQGRGREKRKIKRKKSRRERVRRKKMQMREKVEKPRNTVFFQWFWAPEGRKVGSLKRRVQSHLARWEMKNCTPLWREAHFEVKMYKTHHGRTTFGSWDVEKVHAVVARSTFPSENVQNTTCLRHFWRFRCRKSARRCGPKHISKPKC